MRIEMACFTDRGEDLGGRLAERLSGAGDTVRLERCGDGGVSLREWTAARFGHADALVFIGAVGVAVRAVAPHLVSKTSDPAVAVVDDGGRFAVSLLSGHIGGANALAERIAGMLGATPVVTTATDGCGAFAIDTWASRNGFAIRNPDAIKRVSGKLLAGKRVTLHSAFPVEGGPPLDFDLCDGDSDVVIDVCALTSRDALHLVPPALILGVGCRRKTTPEALDRAFDAFCLTAGLCPEAFGKVCSIDLKQREEGLVEFCRRHCLPFETFDAQTLGGVEGEFSASAFVAAATGVDNVCERSAIAGGGIRLVAGKTALDGIAMAAAVRACTVRFPGDGEESA